MSKMICGIVMPISPMEDCDTQHWVDVKDIISDAILSAGYEPQLVSMAAEVSIIQGRIIQNLYQNPVIVCDISCKNANVMFELGIRLAFDMPVIVIKDDRTGYPFDTAPIEHLTYPRTLRHGTINKFKTELADKIIATAAAKEKDPSFSPFLKSFGPFKAVSIETKEVPAQELIMDMVQSLSDKIDRLSLQGLATITGRFSASQRFKVPQLSNEEEYEILNRIKTAFDKCEVSYEVTPNNCFIRVAGFKLDNKDVETISDIIRSVTMKRVSVSVTKLDGDRP